MDVSDELSVRACADALVSSGVDVDVVVNNAAIYLPVSSLEVESDTMRRAVHTNLLGPFWVCRAFAPGMIRAGYGRMVNVSSELGACAGGLGGPVTYSVTKAALNALTVAVAADLPSGIKVNAVCPGWVRTRMGQPARRGRPRTRPTASFGSPPSLRMGQPAGSFVTGRRSDGRLRTRHVPRNLS